MARQSLATWVPDKNLHQNNRERKRGRERKRKVNEQECAERRERQSVAKPRFSRVHFSLCRLSIFPLIHRERTFYFSPRLREIVLPLRYSPRGARVFQPSPVVLPATPTRVPFSVTTVVFYKEVHFVPRLQCPGSRGTTDSGYMRSTTRTTTTTSSSWRARCSWGFFRRVHQTRYCGEFYCRGHGISALRELIRRRWKPRLNVQNGYSSSEIALDALPPPPRPDYRPISEDVFLLFSYRWWIFLTISSFSRKELRVERRWFSRRSILLKIVQNYLWITIMR